MPDRVYNFVKWLSIAGLPWLAMAYGGLSALFVKDGLPALPYADQICDIIVYIGGALAALLMIASKDYYQRLSVDSDPMPIGGTDE